MPPMPPLIHVSVLPSLVPAGALQNAAAVVIDLLRASTTITHALASNAARVTPALTIEDARRLRDEQQGQRVLLAGERAGVRIDGFDLGNSPSEFTASTVGGTTIVFTTTNGTRAIIACRGARRVLVGCFANISAIERSLAPEPDVHFVCAGTDNEPTFEDTLFAGALAARLVSRGFAIGNDQARLAIEAWNSVSARPGGVVAALHASRGGRNLASIGLADDVDECALLDTCAVVPELVDGVLVAPTEPWRRPSPRA